MEVEVNGLAWLPKHDLSYAQLRNLKQLLTVVPKQVGDYAKENPQPIHLFEETETHIGIARGFFQARRRDIHKVTWDLTEGRKDLWAGKEEPLEFEGTLRSEQKQAIDEVALRLRAGQLGGIIRAVPGWGKTVAACALIAELKVPTLVVVHKEFLVNQWKERLEQFLPGVKIGIVQQNSCDYKDKHVVIGMVHSLGAKEYPAEFYEWPGFVVIDESLGYSSRILTDSGYRPIGEIVENPREDVQVLAYDTRSRQFEWRPVTKRWVHAPKSPMLRITHERGVLECTSNHEVLTPFGYERAGNLVPGADSVVCCDHVESRALAERSKGVDHRFDVGGRVYRTQQEREQSSFLCSPFSEADRASECEVQGTKFVCPDTAEDSPEYGVGAGNAKVRHQAASRSGGTPASLLPTREKESGRSVGSRKLVGRSSSVVVDGRRLREPERESTDFTHPRVLAREGRGVGGVADGRIAGPGARHAGSKIQGAIVERGGIEDRGAPGFCVHYSLDEVQDRTDPRRASDNFVRAMRGGDTSGSGEIRATEVLSGRRVPARSASDGLRTFQGISSRDPGAVPEPSVCCLREQNGVETALHEEVRVLGTVQEGTGYLASAEAILRDSERNDLGDPVASKILSVEAVETPALVYDLSVGEHHNFVVDGAVVHNCHRIGAYTWAPVPQKFKARWRIGFSATPRRKDGADNVLHYHIGPVLFSAKEKRMSPKIKRVWTDFKLVKTHSFNPNLAKKGLVLRFLTASTVRNRLIVEQIIRAVNAGRKLLVLSERVKHLQVMDAMFHDMWPRQYGGVPSTDYYVGGRKKGELEIAREARVIFATSQYAQEGLDIPALDTLFLTTPLSDVEQAVGRILRPFEGKKEPIVVDIRDDNVAVCERGGKSRDRYYSRVT